MEIVRSDTREQKDDALRRAARAISEKVKGESV